MAGNSINIMNLGIQLYSVLNAFKQDERRILESLADIGYQGVEFAFSFGAQAPEQLAENLRRLNLSPISFYSSYRLEEIVDPGHEMYARAKALKMKYITVGSGNFVRMDWPETVKKISAIARVAREHGLTLNYHNHTEEFALIGGKHALALLAEQTDPELVKIELDTHFAMKAGENPLAWMERFAGRMPLLHIKDINLKDNSVLEVGDGDLDLENILKTAESIGVQWAIVEFHNIAGRLPLESARRCVSNLRQYRKFTAPVTGTVAPR
jgi:sugar phosphate isomerase/epimerase